MIKNTIKNNKRLYSIVRPIKYRVVRPIYLAAYTTARHLLVKCGLLSSHDRKLKELKNIYNGKTAFIIGNGPSLTAADLDLIRECGGISFATNKIYLIFPQTKWRPEFYMAVDGALLHDKNNSIVRVMEEGLSHYIFAPDVFDNLAAAQKELPCVYRFHKKRNDIYKPVTEFSDNPIAYMVDGYTVTYAAIQLAYYLGFEKIVLLGVDCNYSNIRQADGSVVTLDNKQQYFSKEYDAGKANSANLIGMMEAYECAAKFLNAHGIKAYNATRGGNLKAFERCQLEDICEEVRKNNE